MQLAQYIQTFRNDESGAVTVDWVVLTAALVGLGLAVMALVSQGVEDLGTAINTDLSAIDPEIDPFANNDHEPVLTNHDL